MRTTTTRTSIRKVQKLNVIFLNGTKLNYFVLISTNQKLLLKEMLHINRLKPSSIIGILRLKGTAVY